jgi:hypothetical protein
MRSDRAHAFASLAILGFVALACRGSSGSSTSSSTVASSAPSASAKPAMVDATRYSDEIQLAGAVHTKKAVSARQAADASSTVVASLAANQEVGLLVAHGMFVLVSVTDDGVAGQLGWVPLDTFGDVPQLAAVKTAPATSGPTPPRNIAHCGANEIAAAGGGTRCVKRCNKVSDCGEGESCDLLGYWTTAGPRNAKGCHNIMNGGEEVLSPFKGAVDTSNGATRGDLVDATGDECPMGYTRSGASVKCHRICKRDTDCHAPNVCISLPVGPTKVCDESMR